MKAIPASLIAPGHPDFEMLRDIAEDITGRAGGHAGLLAWFPKMLRDAVDEVVDTPRTRRRSYDELEKTEKTYLGTKIEILTRARLGLPKGRLDFVVLNHDVDLKFTIGNNWMIPTEAVGHVCLVAAIDEPKSNCFLGLVVAHPENLTSGANRDAKKSLSAAGFQQIHWLLNSIPCPQNFWRTLPPELVDAVFTGQTGNDRIVTLFSGVLDRPIARRVIEEAGGDQKDFMRRIRSDAARGARDRLREQGILLLQGKTDAGLIRALGLPATSVGEFISHQVSREEWATCAEHGRRMGRE